MPHSHSCVPLESGHWDIWSEVVRFGCMFLLPKGRRSLLVLLGGLLHWFIIFQCSYNSHRRVVDVLSMPSCEVFLQMRNCMAMMKRCRSVSRRTVTLVLFLACLSCLCAAEPRPYNTPDSNGVSLPSRCDGFNSLPKFTFNWPNYERRMKQLRGAELNTSAVGRAPSWCQDSIGSS